MQLDAIWLKNVGQEEYQDRLHPYPGVEQNGLGAG